MSETAQTEKIGFKIQIGSVSNTYFLAVTTAPVAYDGFGTIETFTTTYLKSGETERYVLIQEQHYLWQTQRYASGRHTVRDVINNNIVPNIEKRLWKRLFNTAVLAKP